MTAAGERIPFFSVRDRAGRAVSYRSLWQRRNLVLAALPGRGWESYVDVLDRDREAIQQSDTSLVITHDAIDGLAMPALLIADRWGEIHFVWAPPGGSDGAGADRGSLPGVHSILESLDYVRHKCPECEGEAR